MNHASTLRLVVGVLAGASACLRAPPTPALVEPPAATTKAPEVPEFSSHIEVGQTYTAVLVRRLNTDDWVPALPGTASPAPGIKVIWLNPEVLTGIGEKDPMDRRVEFEVVNRDADDPATYHCRLDRVGR